MSFDAYMGSEVIEVRSFSAPWGADLPSFRIDGTLVRRVGAFGDAHVGLLRKLASSFGCPPALFWFASNSD